jgi:hypothetical protein
MIWPSPDFFLKRFQPVALEHAPDAAAGAVKP